MKNPLLLHWEYARGSNVTQIAWTGAQIRGPSKLVVTKTTAGNWRTKFRHEFYRVFPTALKAKRYAEAKYLAFLAEALG